MHWNTAYIPITLIFLETHTDIELTLQTIHSAMDITFKKKLTVGNLSLGTRQLETMAVPVLKTKNTSLQHLWSAVSNEEMGC